MQGGTFLHGLLALGLASTVATAPVVPRQEGSEGLGDAPDVVTVAPSGPPGATGSLRGAPTLAGPGSYPIETGSTEIPPSDFQLAPNQEASPDLGLFIDLSKVQNPQPIRGDSKDPTDPGPRTSDYDRLNSDIFAPPGTDSGDVPSAKWPLGLSHNRHGTPASAGWARQQNVDNLPVATAMAGVDMRLSPNSYREMHWHTANEWSYILNGSVRISAVNEAGETFIDDLQAGDVWFFPAGIPHTIQAFETGVEFLLVFDDGSFSEDGTFLVSEMFERNPQAVLAKNFRTDVSSFKNIPDGQLYIFPGTPPSHNISTQNVTGPAGVIPLNSTYSYHLSQQAPYEVPGGNIKIIDPLSFPVASAFSAAIITVEPGAMRELHWHTRSDEWSYFISGQARLTVFSAPESSRTFDFTAGDVGYVPVPAAHYIENTGTENVVYIEVLQAPVYNDISVGQWLGLTSPQVVKDHLKLPDDVINDLPKVKPFLIPGNKDLSTTNFTGNPL